jgi:ribonuclease D
MDDSHIHHPVYVDNNQQLQHLCEQWRHCSVLVLDTEFIRTDTFYPIAGLIQLSDGEGCFLIDPLVIDDFSPFAELLINESIVKVLHSCSEDLEVFDRLLGVIPKPVYDTQIAAALAGYGFSLGYQKLVDEMLQVHVAKGETRSNWLQRPLSGSQIHYAALDVVYLYQVYERLTEKLQLLERDSWCQEECEKLVSKYAEGNGLGDYYLKVKSAWKLSPLQLNCLRELTIWREQQARDKNRPRNRILKDRACFDIAQRQPSKIHELAAVEELSHGAVRKMGDVLLEIVKEASQIDHKDFPPRMPKPLPPAAGGTLKSLKTIVRLRAEHLNLPPELLVKKKDYESLLRSGFNSGEYCLPKELRGWREGVIGEELLASLQGA